MPSLILQISKLFYIVLYYAIYGHSGFWALSITRKLSAVRQKAHSLEFVVKSPCLFYRTINVVHSRVKLKNNLKFKFGCGRQICTAVLELMKLTRYFFSIPQYMVFPRGFEPRLPDRKSSVLTIRRWEHKNLILREDLSPK